METMNKAIGLHLYQPAQYYFDGEKKARRTFLQPPQFHEKNWCPQELFGTMAATGRCIFYLSIINARYAHY